MIDYYNVEVEVWKEVPGFPGYQASNLGNIRSWMNVGYAVRNESRVADRPKPVKMAVSKYGYGILGLYDEAGCRINKRWHRVILETFMGPCPDGMEALHWDGDRLNNRLDNLSWGDRTKNMRDKRRHGTQPEGSLSHNAVLTEDQLIEMKRLRREHRWSYQKLADAFGVSKCSAHRAVTGITWKHMADKPA
jgi:hypothetical protein